jgi:hypothetical protein
VKAQQRRKFNKINEEIIMKTKRKILMFLGLLVGCVNAQTIEPQPVEITKAPERLMLYTNMEIASQNGLSVKKYQKLLGFPKPEVFPAFAMPKDYPIDEAGNITEPVDDGSLKYVTDPNITKLYGDEMIEIKKIYRINDEKFISVFDKKKAKMNSNSPAALWMKNGEE